MKLLKMTCSNSHDALPPPPAPLPRLPTRRTSACSPPAFGLIKMPSKLTPHPHFQRGLAGNSSIGLESDASHPSGRLTRRMSNLSVVLFRQPTTVCLLLAPDRDGEGCREGRGGWAPSSVTAHKPGPALYRRAALRCGSNCLMKT